MITPRGGKEETVGLEFLRDFAEAAGQNRKIILSFSPNSRREGIVKEGGG